MTSATTFEASESAARRLPPLARDTDDDFCGGGSAHNEDDEGCTPRLVVRGGIFGTQMDASLFCEEKTETFLTKGKRRAGTTLAKAPRTTTTRSAARVGILRLLLLS